MIPEDSLIPTYAVISRHSAKFCEKKNPKTGELPPRSEIRCSCFKFITIYDPRETDPKLRYPKPIPTKTRSFKEAEQIAQAHRDQHDPDKARAMLAEAKLKAIEAEKKSQTVTIEKAVAMFLSSKKAEGISYNRIKRYHPLLGHIDPVKLTFVSARNRGRGGKGHLFEWLDTLNPRPVNVSDLTPVLVEEFRNTWDFPSDLTHRISFGDLKGFFNYCLSKRWIQHHPMAGMRARKIKKGSRTTAFSDAQYDSIITVIKSRFTAEANIEQTKQHEDTHRLLAFVELMRWSGMALEDAGRLKLSTVKDNGEMSYKRVKTGNVAKPILLPHVVDLLKATVPVDGDLNQPFYDKAVTVSTNKNRWSTAVKEVCFAAGIDLVKTDLREREPHCHMFRDTFAVGQLRTQYELNQIDYQGIADALGDKVQVFLDHYAPQIEELKQAKLDAQRRIINAQAVKRAQKQSGDKVVTIGSHK